MNEKGIIVELKTEYLIKMIEPMDSAPRLCQFSHGFSMDLFFYTCELKMISEKKLDINVKSTHNEIPVVFHVF